MNCSECKHIERVGTILYCNAYNSPKEYIRNCEKFEQYVEEEEYTHTEIAEKIIDMGKAKNFITIAIGMLENRECDLNGCVGMYARDMEAIKRKAIHELDEGKE